MSLSLLLHCADLAETARFYRAALDFDVRDDAGVLTVGKHDGTLIFTTQQLWPDPTGCSGTIYFSVPDVDAYFAVVRDRVTLAWPLQDMAYGGKEFATRDCNGYLLAFRQP